jgi:hypothetical protein
MATLAEFRERATLRALEKMGESVTFQPAGDSTRELLAIPVDENEVSDDRRDAQVDNEVLWLHVARDPAAAIGGTTIGGIDMIEVGDTILRASDPPTAFWGFQGAIRNIDEFSWDLKFARVRPTRYGPRLP